MENLSLSGGITDSDVCFKDTALLSVQSPLVRAGVER